MKKIRIMALLASAAFCCAAYGQDFRHAASESVLEQIEGNMVYVTGGTFNMGSRDYENNESPVHSVTVSDFLISAYEVRQSQYRNIMGINYSAFRGNDHPVEEVSWYDAVVFCNRLSLASGLVPCYSLKDETDPDMWGDVPRIMDENLEEKKILWNLIECNFEADGYRLPTEAEWEYAASGISGDYLYAGSDNPSEVAWFAENSEETTHDVGALAPNELGLYDMSGNVWEWCWDWYAGKYDYDEALNPKGGSEEVTGRRIRRGGSINSQNQFLRNSNRASSVPELRGVDLGIRLVRSVKAYAPVELSVISASLEESGKNEVLKSLNGEEESDFGGEESQESSLENDLEAVEEQENEKNPAVEPSEVIEVFSIIE